MRRRFSQLLAVRRVRVERVNRRNRSVLPETFVNSVGITMKLIQPGKFLMGSANGGSDEMPVHEVEITQPFYMGVYEVTGAQYARVMGGSGGPAPKTWVSWNQATEFCKRLSAMEGARYMLPTEAQWEYACRAGTQTAYSFGESWSSQAAKGPNPWGLYDMHGNVLEWCSDWYGPYSSGNQRDPTGPSSGSYRVGRGGDWDRSARYCRSAVRYWRMPGRRIGVLGFRLLRTSQ
ncbi:MAG: formylglycine-generating enzyme family protein [Planctomycetes bacterium]|nr:formylglycine-generating enzyme family protein [Planctomycetota bacterium]